MPWRIQARGGEYCILKEIDNSTVACHATKEKAVAQLRALYAAEPNLAACDWPEQRIIASAALRGRELLARGGNELAVAAALRLIDPSPLGDRELVFLDEVARTTRERSIARDMAGRRWPVYAAPAVTKARARVLSKKMAGIEQRLADQLYAGAVTTMREALRRAGIKARVRAKNRPNAAKAALEDGMTDAVLAAIAVSPDELLDRAFETYGTDVQEWIGKANTARLRAIAESWDVDPEDLIDQGGPSRAKEAAVILVALLLGAAKSALSGTKPAEEPVVTIPFGMIRTALRVKDGWSVTPGRAGLQALPPVQDLVKGLIGQAAERAAPLPDLEALARGEDITPDLSGVVPELVRTYEWVHGYFGEPNTPFIPHDLLDGEVYTDETRDDVLSKDPGEWPEGNYVWSVDDHDSCTCYEVITYEPA